MINWGAENPACFPRKLELHTLLREPQVDPLQIIVGGGDRIIKGEVSTCPIGVKMMTIEACLSSLGKDQIGYEI